MFERFTSDARAVVMDAQLHARRLGHGYIGCEHLLLAAATGPTASVLADQGLTANRIEAVLRDLIGQSVRNDLDRMALASIGIDLDEVLRAVEANFGADALRRAGESVAARRRRLRLPLRRRAAGSGCVPGPGRIPFTPRAKKCLELAVREAISLSHRHISADHIVLALLRDDTTMAARVFHELRVDTPNLRRAVVDSLRRSA